MSARLAYCRAFPSRRDPFRFEEAGTTGDNMVWESMGPGCRRDTCCRHRSNVSNNPRLTRAGCKP